MKLSFDYVAGIIDGEGTITLSRIHKSDPWRSPVISVSSTTPEILFALAKAFGGHICKHKAYQQHHLPAFSWRLTNRKAIALCEQLQHVLLVPEKKRRAQLIARDYLKCTPRNGKYTELLRKKKTRFETTFFNSATENRTPVSTLKGSRPKPLDDSAADTRTSLAS